MSITNAVFRATPKTLLISLISMFILAACADGRGGGGGGSGGGEVDQFSLTTLIERLAKTGDLAARAIIVSGVQDDLDDSNFPLRLYLIDEGNFAYGSSSPAGKTETVFKRGDKPLLDYLARQNMSETDFLEHPLLKKFLESHLIKEQVNINDTQNGTSETYTTVAGNEITLNVEDNKVFANGVATQQACHFTERAAGGPNVYGEICFAQDTLIEDFDWEQ